MEPEQRIRKWCEDTLRLHMLPAGDCACFRCGDDWPCRAVVGARALLKMLDANDIRAAALALDDWE